MKELTDKEIEILQRDVEKPPRVCELGGGIYYKCFWINCGEDLKRWYTFCPKCGQRIDWKESI